MSFRHTEYQDGYLRITVKTDDNEYDCDLCNITKVSWWDKAPQIKTWYIGNKYHIEVRANEFDYHPPHFHVSCGEVNAVYKLKDGELYKSGNKKLPPGMADDIRSFYSNKKDELVCAWELLHGITDWK